MDLVSVLSQKIRYQSLSRTRNIIRGVLQTVVIYPSRNIIAIRSLTNVRSSGPIEIVGTQKSLDPTQNKRLPPNLIRVATLSRLRPQTALKISCRYI
jgi:hypothetical protein